MPRRREETLPSSEMTSMIDIIFQLLIFFLVTLSLGTVQSQSTAEVVGEMKEDVPDLPPMKQLTESERKLTEGYILHIDEDKENQVRGDLVAWIFDPEFPSLAEAKKDSSGNHGPFSLDEAKKRIDELLGTHLMMKGEPTSLKMRAHEDTEYGFVLDIMGICNADSIKTVDFNLLHAKKD
ncbi:MAG: ExbD/TolR family protein [Candidatus Zixiibacteriota bacterium]